MGYAQFQNRTLEILEPGRSGDWPSKFCDYFIAALVVMNVLAVTLESVSDFSVNYTRQFYICLLYTSPSPRDRTRSRMPSSA